MKAFTTHTGIAVPLRRDDVDTDQIIASDWLKRVSRSGYGEGLFGQWRADPSFVLNDPRYAGGSILVTGANFGTGSSREHAVWALDDYGFRAVVAPSFADIFRGNATKVGVVPVVVSDDVAAALLDAAEAAAVEVTVDLVGLRVTCAAAGVDEPFPIDDFTRERLIAGMDDVATTLTYAPAIASYEARRPDWLPRV